MSHFLTAQNEQAFATRRSHHTRLWLGNRNANPLSETKSANKRHHWVPPLIRTKPELLPAKSIQYLQTSWIRFVTQALGSAPPAHIQGLLRRIELVGATIRVIASKNPSYVGVRGVIVDETEQLLMIQLFEKNKIIRLLKKGTHFLLEYRETKYVLIGDGLLRQPCERTKAKTPACYGLRIT